MGGFKDALPDDWDADECDVIGMQRQTAASALDVAITEIEEILFRWKYYREQPTRERLEERLTHLRYVRRILE